MGKIRFYRIKLQRVLDWGKRHDPAVLADYLRGRRTREPFAVISYSLSQISSIPRRKHGHGKRGEVIADPKDGRWLVSAEVGGVALAVEAKDENAARWYEWFGALRLRAICSS
jgi:hypothetical protein